MINVHNSTLCLTHTDAVIVTLYWDKLSWLESLET